MLGSPLLYFKGRRRMMFQLLALAIGLPCSPFFRKPILWVGSYDIDLRVNHSKGTTILRAASASQVGASLGRT